MNASSEKAIDPETTWRYVQEAIAVSSFDQIHEMEIELSLADKQFVRDAEVKLKNMTTEVQAAPNTIAGYTQLIQLIDQSLPPMRDSLGQMQVVVSRLPTETRISEIRGEIEHLLREISDATEETMARNAAESAMRRFAGSKLDAEERRRELQGAREKLVVAGQGFFEKAKDISLKNPPKDSIKPVHQQFRDATDKFLDYASTENKIISGREASFLSGVEQQSMVFKEAVEALLQNRGEKANQTPQVS